jgi:hypothetical protein
VAQMPNVEQSFSPQSEVGTPAPNRICRLTRIGATE